jgi:hypothetical protein
MHTLTKKQEGKLITEKRGHDITGVGDHLNRSQTEHLSNMYLMDAEDNNSYAATNELEYAI